VEHLVDARILREVTGQKRRRVFIADEVIEAVEGHKRRD
jgi:hypothetical protein